MTGDGHGAPLLAARGLEVGHRRTLLRGVELELRAGESWFVVGRNGSGKSTLVATLLGLLRPRAGRVECAPSVRKAIGYVPQEPRFEPTLPLQVAEFVAAGIDDRVARHEAAARIGDAMAALGITELSRCDVRALSTGQRRRVAVARAFARRPVLLVLDEPLANLDGDAALALAADLDRRRREGTCVLHVAHELDVARRHATHVAVVAAATVRAGEAASMFAEPAFAAATGEVRP